MAGRLRCTLLCEDLEQERLFRPILERMFGGRGRVYVEPRNPSAHGGVTFVLKSFPKCMARVRRSPQEAVGLVVVLDGDELGLSRRLKELDETLDQKRGSHERVAACVPTRNVETWEYWLCGARDVDESTDYKIAFQREVGRGSMNRNRAVEAWFAQSSEAQRQLEVEHVPSLAAGRQELASLQTKSKPG
jgi:hypothetical protein